LRGLAPSARSPTRPLTKYGPFTDAVTRRSPGPAGGSAPSIEKLSAPDGQRWTIAMAAAVSAPSASIHGSSPRRNTPGRPSVQMPECAHSARLSWMVIPLPRYGCAASGDTVVKRVPSKPIFACVPSQNGLFDELPQRHSANLPRAGTSSPRALRTRHGPLTRYGPFFTTSIVVSSAGACAVIYLSASVTMSATSFSTARSDFTDCSEPDAPMRR
jgi:hypothetical protein